MRRPSQRGPVRRGIVVLSVSGRSFGRTVFGCAASDFAPPPTPAASQPPPPDTHPPHPPHKDNSRIAIETARNRGHMLRKRNPLRCGVVHLWGAGAGPREGKGGALALAGCGVQSAGHTDSQGGKRCHTHMTWMAASRDMMVHSVLEDKADTVCEKAASAAQVKRFSTSRQELV